MLVDTHCFNSKAMHCLNSKAHLSITSGSSIASCDSCVSCSARLTLDGILAALQHDCLTLQGQHYLTAKKIPSDHAERPAGACEAHSHALLNLLLWKPLQWLLCCVALLSLPVVALASVGQYVSPHHICSATRQPCSVCQMRKHSILGARQ